MPNTRVPETTNRDFDPTQLRVLGPLTIYTLSDTSILTLTKDYRKSPGHVIFLESELLAAAESIQSGIFASQGSTMYELESPAAEDYTAKLEIGLCQFTAVLIRKTDAT